MLLISCCVEFCQKASGIEVGIGKENLGTENGICKGRETWLGMAFRELWEDWNTGIRKE